MPGPFDFNGPQHIEEEEAGGSPARRSFGREPPKTRLVYILLALFLGGLGIHNFYAGRTAIGVMQLIGVPVVALFLAVFTLGIGLIFFIPAVIAWLLAEIAIVNKDGSGKWMV